MVWAYPVGKVAAHLLCKANGEGMDKSTVAGWETWVGSMLTIVDPIGGGVLAAHGIARRGCADREGNFSDKEKKVCRVADKAIQAGVAIKSAGALGDLTGSALGKS